MGLGKYAGAFFANWRGFDAPGRTKLRLAFRNRSIAMVKGCCGHHGEPGC